MRKVKHFISAGVMAVFLFAALASSSDKDTESKISKTEAQTPAIDVTASQLTKDYAANEVAADQKYKGKVLNVTGIVIDISKDITDGIYVVLSTSTDEFTGVQCTFSDDHTNEAAALQKGQKITIKGLCGGLMMNVQLSGSSIVK